MAMELSSYQSQITSKLTKQGAEDFITAEEIRDVFLITKNLLQERGLVQVENLAALSNLSLSETQFAYVDNDGFFKYSPTGVPDNENSFPAPNGGMWVRKVAGGGGSGELNANLQAIANLNVSNDEIIQRKGGVWVNRTMAQVKADLGLNNVPNTDATNPSNIIQKPTHRFVTDDEKAAWNLKQNPLTIETSPVQGSTSPISSNAVYVGLGNKVDKATTVNGQALSSNVVISKVDIGLNNVDNTSDVNKPVSTAQATAINSAQAGAVSTIRGGVDASADTLSKLHNLLQTNIANVIDGAPTPGNTLNKLYNLAINAIDTVNVADIGARNLLNVRVGQMVFVQNDGDNNWALYRANTAGTNATYTKLSDPDMFGAAMTAEQVAVSYESNPDTNKFTTAHKTKLDNLPTGFIVNGDVDAQYLPDVNFNPAHFELKTVNGTPNVICIKQSILDDIATALADGGGSVGADATYISLPPVANPTPFTATASSESKIDLAWGAISGSSYIIQRSTTPTVAASWTTINSPAVGITSYEDISLQPSTQYYYRICAVGNGGTNRNSEWLFANDTTDAESAPETGAVVRKEAEAFDSFVDYAVQQLYANNDADNSLYQLAVRSSSSLTYSINTAAGGSHQVTFRYMADQGTTHLLFKDGSGNLLADVELPFSNVWASVTVPITLLSGIQNVKIERGSGSDFNLNWFEIDNSLQSPVLRQVLMTAGNTPEFNEWPGVVQWNGLGTDAATMQAGTYTKNDLRSDHFVKHGWGIQTTNAWADFGGAAQPPVADTGIFGKDILTFKNWRGNNGSALKFTGLNPAKTYDVWVLANSWENPNVVSFTIGGTTTSTKDARNNYGDNVAYPDWHNDPALLHVSGITPNGSGEIAMVCNLISGAYVPVSAIIIREN